MFGIPRSAKIAAALDATNERLLGFRESPPIVMSSFSVDAFPW
jgi:hypothetical protein